MIEEFPELSAGGLEGSLLFLGVAVMENGAAVLDQIGQNFEIVRIGRQILETWCTAHGIEYRIQMPQTTERPFAYSISKLDVAFGVRPTLPSALDAARDMFTVPSVTIELTAWFPDGTNAMIPHDTLCTPDKSAWISAEQAMQVEYAMFPFSSGQPEQ